MNGLDLRTALHDWFTNNDWSTDELKRRIDQWTETYLKGNIEDLNSAIKLYNESLTAHKAKLIPRPADLKDKYRDVLVRKEMDKRNQEEGAQNRLAKKVNSFNPSDWNPPAGWTKSRAEGIIQQRAHSLCKHWQGFGGYTEKGIIGRDDKRRPEETTSDRIIAIAFPNRDIQMDIEAQALQFITMGLYTRPRVPDHIQTKHKWTAPHMVRNPLREGINFIKPEKKAPQVPEFVAELQETPFEDTIIEVEPEPEPQPEVQPEPVKDEFHNIW